MKNFLAISFTIFLLTGCGSSRMQVEDNEPDYVIAFGSCNNQTYRQPLWEPIMENNPDLFIWAGDNVYADTDDPVVMKTDYQKQKENEDYIKLLNSVKVIGTWDDHDFGKNDGGVEWHFKEEAQQMFLDFFDVAEDSPRREREGVYHSEIFKTEKGSIKVILLDARYFRSPVKRTEEEDWHYTISEGTILGEEQWKWLEDELNNSNADFNILVSGIQYLSKDHGYEKWANFPHEVERLENLMVTSKARNIIFLSGDRHISEFSVKEVDGLNYDLMDFTSSGMTHSWNNFSGEVNEYRKGKVVDVKSFGILKFDFETNKVHFEMRGTNNEVQQDYILNY